MVDSARNLLDNLERQLTERVNALRRELEPLERELENVRRAQSALADTIDASSFTGSIKSPQAQSDSQAAYRYLTMKQLVRKALKEHFQNGATANELLEFFAKHWGRNDIVRSSLSPQLSRLKWDGEIDRQNLKWFLRDESSADVQSHHADDEKSIVKNLNGEPVTVTEFRGNVAFVKVGNEEASIPVDVWRTLPEWNGSLPFDANSPGLKPPE